MTQRQSVADAMDEVAAKYPWLAEAIAGCLVGWPDLTIPPTVYQALVIKVSEAIDKNLIR